MVSVDFTSWVSPDLELTLGGHTYQVRPPSVARGRQITACVVRAEINLGLVQGTIPDDLAAVLEQIATDPLGVITLGRDVYDRMVADEVPVLDIDRAAYYAMWFWARGKGMADWVANLMWAPDQNTLDEGEQGPKARRRPRSKSGRSTASGSRTRTASTPTTASPQS